MTILMESTQISDNILRGLKLFLLQMLAHYDECSNHEVTKVQISSLFYIMQTFIVTGIKDSVKSRRQKASCFPKHSKKSYFGPKKINDIMRIIQ